MFVFLCLTYFASYKAFKVRPLVAKDFIYHMYYFHLSPDRHLSCFCALAIVNNAA